MKTPQDQVMKTDLVSTTEDQVMGGGNFPKYSCVLIITHNSLAGVEMSLRGDSVNK